MNNSDPREKLLQVLRDTVESGCELSIADLDGIETLAELCSHQLPDRFFSIIDEFHENGGRFELVFERLYRIMAVTMEFPAKVWRDANEELLPTFSLDETDRDRVMKLCGGMRKIVFSSGDFDEPHKRRLLNRIAAIEYQVSQEKGLFDVVLGGVSDIGETFGKFGRDIKPLIDRYQEVVRITRRNTKEYDQLPAPEETKQLPAPDDRTEE